MPRFAPLNYLSPIPLRATDCSLMGALVCLSLTLCALLAGCSKTAFWSAHEFDAISAKLKSPSDWKWKLDGYRLIGESPSSAIMGEYSILFYPRLQGDMSPELAFALVAKIPITEMPELKPVSGGFGKCRALTISLPDNSARLSKDAAGAVVVNRAQHSTISAVTGKKGAYIISATVYTVEDKVADSAELINTLKTIQSELDVGCK